MGRYRWFNALAHLLLFGAAIALYTVTLNTDVQPADSGEFQIAAITLGIAHPPGYPLYTMLGWLFAQVPLGSPFARVSFLSVVASAATLVLVSLSVQELAGFQRQHQSNEQESALSKATRIDWMNLSAGLIAALALGSCTTFWAQATTSNIRSLTAFFTAFMVFTAVRIGRLLSQSQEPLSVEASKAVSWVLTIFAAAVGLGVGHHVSLVFPATVLGVYVGTVLYRRKQGWRMFVLPLLALILTQLVWLYLPIRDAVGARFAPGDLNTLSGLANHIFARGFAGDMLAFAAPQFLFDRLALLPTIFLFEFSFPVWITMAVATVILIWRLRAIGVTLVLAILVHLFVTITYRAPQTVEYAMPAWVMLAIVLGAGLFELNSQLVAALLRKHAMVVGQVLQRLPLPVGVGLLIFLLPITYVVRDTYNRYPSFTALATDRGTRSLAQGVLEAVEPASVVLSPWHQATALWALQDIEGIRRDVTVQYVYPQGAQPYADTFADDVARSATVSPTYVTGLYDLPFSTRHLASVPLPGQSAWRVVPIERNLSTGASNLNLQFDNRIDVFSVRASTTRTEVGKTISVDIAWRLVGSPGGKESLTVRILRRDGRLASNADVSLNADQTGDAPQIRRLIMGIPLDLEPGDYQILVGAYQADQDGFHVLPERGGADFVPIAALTVTPAKWAPATEHPMQWSLPDDAQLVGVDYDTGMPGRFRVLTHWRLSYYLTHTISIQDVNGQRLAAPKGLPIAQGAENYYTLVFDTIPVISLRLSVQDAGRVLDLPDIKAGDRYIPFADQMVLVGSDTRRVGDQLKASLQWLCARPLVNDYIVSVRVDGSDFQVAHDGVPALGALPTLKWIRGSLVSDPHTLPIGTYTGTLHGTVVVYDSFTGQNLPSLDERYENGITFAVK